MTVRLELVTDLDVPPDVAFDLSRDVTAHTMSMAHSRERAVAGVTSGPLELGDTVTWRAVHFGIPWTMTSTVTEYDRPMRFVDEQARGPFAMFHHEHLFEPTDAGHSRMTDRIVFRAPAGLLGRAAESLMLARYMRRLIQTRNEFLRQQQAQPRR